MKMYHIPAIVAMLCLICCSPDPADDSDMLKDVETEQTPSKDEDPGSQDSEDSTPDEKPGSDGQEGSDDKPDSDGSDEKVPAGYALVWKDDFSAKTLDESCWNIEVNGDGGGNQELQFYRSENVSLGVEPVSRNTCLVLTARKEDFGGRKFTSGRVNTKKKVAFKYGRFDASIRLPKTADGLWPAFWLMGDNYDEVGWPRCGEIDILEMGNAEGIRKGTQDRYFNGACHWGFYKDLGGNNWAYPNYAKASTWDYSLQDDRFHLFTLIWDEEKVSMYVDLDKFPDVRPYYEMTITDKGDDWGVGHYFHHEYFILFNLAVGGHFTGILSPSGITALANTPEASMYVDYVEVYRKK